MADGGAEEDPGGCRDGDDAHVHVVRQGASRDRPFGRIGVANAQAFKAYGMDFEAIPKDGQFGEEIAKRSAELIKTNNIRAPPVNLFGGLDSIGEGFEFQKVSHESIVIAALSLVLQCIR